MTRDTLPSLPGNIDPDINRILSRALEGEEISGPEALELCETIGADFHATVFAADQLRKIQVGDTVTYVINRNINFTNVCVKACGFCAFSRTYRNEEGYLLTFDEIIRRTVEAVEMGATEVCMQAGMPPDMDGNLYVDLTREVKKVVPDVHIHAFSPEEVLYGATRSATSIEDYLKALKEAGLDSLPGTSAEILDQEVRDVISPGRITVKQWVEVIRTAHSLGIPTTSTIMYGHIETPLHWVKHMELLRDIQHDTGGITEFVPLSMISQEAPMYRHRVHKNMRPGPSGMEVVKLHAVARLMLGASIPNVQSSWVKEGPPPCAVPAGGGSKRRGRDTDEREYFHLSRRPIRTAYSTERTPTSDSRCRTHSGPAKDELRVASRIRRRRERRHRDPSRFHRGLRPTLRLLHQAGHVERVSLRASS